MFKYSKSINKVREDCGLNKIKPGKRNCLYCNKSFESEDVTRERICRSCKGNVIFTEDLPILGKKFTKKWFNWHHV